MGAVVGEKLARLFEKGINDALPVLVVSSSGGARMQEGVVSLMQLAKIASVIARFKEGNTPFISLLTNPTTGGVAASVAFLGDIILALPDALIGFAGPRVIQQTIGTHLPEGFQRSEFLLEHGMIDSIVERSRLKDTLLFFLKAFGIRS